MKIFVPRFVLIILVFEFLCLPAQNQSLDYAEIFAEDWKKALVFERDNRSWMDSILTGNHISYSMGIAVIFPELVRYSALQDKIEITLLKTLYVNLGDNYANFSIGRFQMKPSFAQKVREAAATVMNRKSGIRMTDRAGYDDVKDYRRSIVKDLEDPKSELNYLVVFLKICEKNFRTSKMDETSRIRFMATAYNYGIDKSYSEIESMINKKFFNTKLYKTENYSYADVSLYWYNHFRTGNLR